MARFVSTRHGMTRFGLSARGRVRHGMSARGLGWEGRVRLYWRGWARFVCTGFGLARLGWAWFVCVGLGAARFVW